VILRSVNKVAPKEIAKSLHHKITMVYCSFGLFYAFCNTYAKIFIKTNLNSCFIKN
jgi:hypothetical protein